jgi:hypothetical protein
MAERTGLEPATPGVTGRYSNQLNYRSEFWGANPNGLIDKATSAFTPSTGQPGPHGTKIEGPCGQPIRPRGAVFFGNIKTLSRQRATGGASASTIRHNGIHKDIKDPAHEAERY